MTSWIRESNLIEEVDEPAEDARSLRGWNWFLKQSLSCDTILWLHRRIMAKKLKARDRGRWRKTAVSVGGRLGSHHAYLPELMAQWSLLHSRATTEETIKAAHIKFEWIHPFVDGNGRTGRMIMNWQRVKAGMEPLTIFAAERGEYYKWFR